MSTPTRVWFITGSSSGLGRNLLETVLAAGERAVATLRKPETLKELQDLYPPTQLLVVRLDVTQSVEVTAAFSAAEKHFGLISVVVNNAGFGLLSEIEGTPDSDARGQFEVNFWGMVYGDPVLPRGQSTGYGGRFLNMSTVGGYSGNQGLAFYSASKFALEGFTEAAIKEVLPDWLHHRARRLRHRMARRLDDDPPPAPRIPQRRRPSARMRAHLAAQKFNGDISKASKTLMEVASLPKMPLRLPLNTEAYCLVKMKAERTLAQLEEFAPLSHGTNKDGVDRAKVMDSLGVVNH
ncbi:NAD(P)-binding protein [Mycena leptocephala]|nr:NAD(P)-binding protein [Mycena leptocephala]